MITSEKIYTKDAKGTLRFWFYEVDGAAWRGVSGQIGGVEVRSGWTTSTAKSRATDEEQALFEANAEENKKLDRKYRRNPDNCDDVFIQPMLAQDYDKLKKPLVFPVGAQPKLDGMRAIISAAGATSRQGQPINTIPHIVEALAPVFAEYPDLILDGEIYNHALKDDFNSLMSLARKSKDLTEEEAAEARSKLEYHVYDIADASVGDFGERFMILEDIFLYDMEIPGVILVESIRIEDQPTLDRHLEDWLFAGYEGQMVRILGMEYEHKRSKGLLKRKDFTTAEFKVLRIEEGNGNWGGYAKRVVFELEDGRENEAGIRGNQAFCKDLLERRENFEKGWVTIRFMKQRTPDGKLRAPVAIDWHPEGRKD